MNPSPATPSPSCAPELRPAHVKSGRLGRSGGGIHPVDSYAGQRARLRRLALGLSQEAVAAHLGVAFQQLQKYEKGQNRISASRLQQLATALDVPVVYFFPQTGDAADGDADVTVLLADRAALRLARAFAAITNPDMRAAIITMAEGARDSSSSAFAGTSVDHTPSRQADGTSAPESASPRPSPPRGGGGRR
jgi:transcriptional regulator with XRE-family HTH domain